LIERGWWYRARMTHVLIAVDDTEGSVVAAKTAYNLFGDQADYTVISVAEEQPVYWGDDALGPGAVYPLAVPAVGSGMAATMPLTVRVPDGAPSDDVPAPVDVAAQRAEHVVAEAGMNHAKPLGDIGDPADAIIAAAHDYKADVIVVGSHEHGWLSRLFTSSVGEKVVRKADTPVLVAR
jgi:nucleotide-binding universal stress UspA family protein